MQKDEIRGARFTVTETAKAQAPTSPWLDRDARAFLLRKLFSLTGVVPLAAFTIFHLWKNAAALQGREAFTAMAEEIEAMPYLVVLEVVFILAPMLLHAVIGVLIVLDAKYNVGSYKYARNWMFTMQRAAGVVTLGFILYHLYELRVPKLLGHLGPSSFYDTLCADLSSTVWGIPAVGLLYVFGIGAVAFHLANGLWGFLCSWGITVSRRSQRISASLLGMLGIVVFALGANTALYFATGSRLFVPSSLRPGGGAACPGSPGRALPEPADMPPVTPPSAPPVAQPTARSVPSSSAPTHP